jgi:hypothetical protein
LVMRMKKGTMSYRGGRDASLEDMTGLLVTHEGLQKAKNSFDRRREERQRIASACHKQWTIDRWSRLSKYGSGSG